MTKPADDADPAVRWVGLYAAWLTAIVVVPPMARGRC